MILPDPALPPAAPEAVRLKKAPAAARAIPHAALARLPVLRNQASQDLALLRFLARAPSACLILMAAGASILLWTRLSTGSAPLEREFAWVAPVLIGMAAMTGLHIQSYAWGAARMPVNKAAVLLRGLLFYTGMAWSMGAFLMMPGLAALAIGFAAAPSLGLGLLLGDQKGVTAFTAPVVLATASAACLRSGPSGVWVAAAILAMGLLVFCLPMLQREISARRDFWPVPKAF